MPSTNQNSDYTQNHMNAHQTNAHLFASLHCRATEVFGTAQIGEYVTEVTGFPWFALALGDDVMVAEYHEADDVFALKTFENEYLVSRAGQEGVAAIWGALYGEAHGVKSTLSNVTAGSGAIE